MRSRLTHDFRRELELRFEHESHACLAIVDLDSYPAFAGGKPDRLDLLRHLCVQTQALTATMWETPDALLSLRIVLARDHRTVEDLRNSGHHVFADGWVRSGGRLCLAGHDRLLDSAGHRDHDLLRSRRIADTRAPRVLLVPPGVYAVTVFSGPAAGAEPEYTIVLRHYPSPCFLGESSGSAEAGSEVTVTPPSSF
jgi:hypothetical protein